MKRARLIVAGLMVCGSLQVDSIAAQDITIVPRLGVNRSWTMGVGGGASRQGLIGGVGLLRSVSDLNDVTAGAMVSRRGNRLVSGGAGMRFTYLELPVAVRLAAPPGRRARFVVSVGLVPAIELSCSAFDTADFVGMFEVDCSGQRDRKWDIGLALAAGVDLALLGLRVLPEIQYTHGVTSVCECTAGLRHKTLSLSLGIGFRR